MDALLVGDNVHVMVKKTPNSFGPKIITADAQ